MAKLKLTKTEKSQHTFLEWNDEALGRAVKKVALICADDNGKEALKATGAAIFLISEAVRSGATEISVCLAGATQSGKELGDWKVLLTKLSGARDDSTRGEELKAQV